MIRASHISIIFLSWLSISMCSFANTPDIKSLNLSNLAENKIKSWEPKIFVGETNYEVGFFKGKQSLKALSEGTASGLFLKQRIDLLTTPYLSWSWFVSNTLPAADERKKSGDDYVARIYVVIEQGVLPWNSKALNYVWSSNQDAFEVWSNAYVGSNVQMLAVRGKDDELSVWHNEKRNVYKDLIKYFGDKGTEEKNQKAYRYIDVVALMTDTDDSQSAAEAYYGDIIFTAE